MEVLKTLRREKNKTQHEIAIELDIPRTKYARYEAGESEPNFEILKRIADYFDVSLDFLLQRPHPHDLPMVATTEQKQAINLILQLNEINVIKAVSYCAGLLANQ